MTTATHVVPEEGRENSMTSCPSGVESHPARLEFKTQAPSPLEEVTFESGSMLLVMQGKGST